MALEGSPYGKLRPMVIILEPMLGSQPVEGSPALCLHLAGLFVRRRCSHTRLFGPVQQGGRQGSGGGEGRRKLKADFPCAQNILKRVEESSEREATALDAHKELELVSSAPPHPTR